MANKNSQGGQMQNRNQLSNQGSNDKNKQNMDTEKKGQGQQYQDGRGYSSDFGGDSGE